MEVALYHIQGVLGALSIRQTLLDWHGSFVDKKHKKVWKAVPLHIFWVVWKARNRMAIDNDMLLIQRLRSYFVFFLWPKTKLSIDDYQLNLVSFVDWLSPYWGCFSPFCVGGGWAVNCFWSFQPLIRRLKFIIGLPKGPSRWALKVSEKLLSLWGMHDDNDNNS